MADEYYVPIRHKRCGRTAFYYEGGPVTGERIKAERARLLDGERPEPHTFMVCGSCGETIFQPETQLEVFT